MEFIVKKHGRVQSYIKAVHRALTSDGKERPSIVTVIPASLLDTQMAIAVVEGLKQLMKATKGDLVQENILLSGDEEPINGLSIDGPQLRIRLTLL